MLLNIISNLKKDIFKINKSELFRLAPLISRSVKTTSQTTSKVETVELAYSSYENFGKTASNKPPLLIFHGVVGTRNGWDGMSKEINRATGRRVITIDARNHGDSPHSTQHTYLHMAHDVIELLKKLDLTKVSVLGHSMGGYTGMVLALIRPDLISSLALEDISPVRTSPQMISIIKLLEAMATIRISSDVPMSKARALAHEHLKTVTADVNIRNYLIQNLVNTNTGLFYTWKTNLSLLTDIIVKNLADFPSNLKNHLYTGPTLFIAGTKSDFIRKSDFPEIRKYFPSAELTFVEGGGHWIHSQRPEKFLEILCKFLIEK